MHLGTHMLHMDSRDCPFISGVCVGNDWICVNCVIEPLGYNFKRRP